MKLYNSAVNPFYATDILLYLHYCKTNPRALSPEWEGCRSHLGCEWWLWLFQSFLLLCHSGPDLSLPECMWHVSEIQQKHKSLFIVRHRTETFERTRLVKGRKVNSTCMFTSLTLQLCGCQLTNDVKRISGFIHNTNTQSHNLSTIGVHTQLLRGKYLLKEKNWGPKLLPHMLTIHRLTWFWTVGNGKIRPDLIHGECFANSLI